MHDETISSIEEVRQVVQATAGVKFQRQGRQESYTWVEKTLVRLRYLLIGKGEKGIVRTYLKRMTGYSRAQVTRLIERYRRTGFVRETPCRRHQFPQRYSEQDVRLLAQTDELHGRPNGAAVKKLLQRMSTCYGDDQYRSIADVSVSHIYNLRKSMLYRRITKHYTHTRPVTSPIGQRRKPNPRGVPGYLRVDTVHQGDRAGSKGVYHINIVDEVTQFQFIAAVEQINEHYLTPLFVKLQENYPFLIREVHADNGSEYINHVVVKLLRTLLIVLTKSRPRHANDNALVETKNGWVLRKWMGYQFIPQRYAARINQFYTGCFNEYLNFHRPCAFPLVITDAKGRTRKRYPHAAYMTPYEKFKSIPRARTYLKPGTTFASLDKIAASKTDNEMAGIIQQQRKRLFKDVSIARDS